MMRQNVAGRTAAASKKSAWQSRLVGSAAGRLKVGSVRHRHHVVVEIGDDPDRAGDDEKDDQHAEGESQNIVCAVGPAAQMQEEDEVDADLREREYDQSDRDTRG